MHFEFLSLFFTHIHIINLKEAQLVKGQKGDKKRGNGRMHHLCFMTVSVERPKSPRNPDACTEKCIVGRLFDVGEKRKWNKDGRASFQVCRLWYLFRPRRDEKQLRGRSGVAEVCDNTVKNRGVNKIHVFYGRTSSCCGDSLDFELHAVTWFRES